MTTAQAAPGDASGSIGDRLSLAAMTRRLPIVLMLGALGFAGGFMADASTPAQYAATTTVLVNPLDGNPFATGTRGQNLANLGTEAQLISSDAVARIAQTALRTRFSTAELVERLEVANPPNSQVLEITFTDSRPAGAKAGADAFANGYLSFRRSRSAEVVQAQIDNLRKAITANEAVVRRNAGVVADSQPGSTKRTLAQQKVNAATSEISRLESQISNLRLFQGDPGQVLSPATLPLSPTGLPSWLIRVGGLLLGLLVGLTVAIWRVLSDRRLRSAGDVTAAGLPVLATISALPAGSGGAAAVLTDPGASLPEGARLLRSVLTVSMPVAGRLLVVPADHAAVHSTSPLSLAAALVRSDRRVTLVDATGGQLSRQLGSDQVAGLSEVLLGVAAASEAAVEYQPGLRFMTAGTASEQVADKLASPRMKDLVRALAPTTPWLIVAGPVATTAEALSLADLCDGVVVVAALGRTTHEDLRRAVDAVTAGGANLVGVALDATGTGRSAGRSRRTPAASDPAADDPTDADPAGEAILPVPAGDQRTGAGRTSRQPVDAVDAGEAGPPPPGSDSGPGATVSVSSPNGAR